MKFIFNFLISVLALFLFFSCAVPLADQGTWNVSDFTVTSNYVTGTGSGGTFTVNSDGSYTFSDGKMTVTTNGSKISASGKISNIITTDGTATMTSFIIDGQEKSPAVDSATVVFTTSGNTGSFTFTGKNGSVSSLVLTLSK